MYMLIDFFLILVYLSFIVNFAYNEPISSVHWGSL